MPETRIRASASASAGGEDGDADASARGSRSGGDSSYVLSGMVRNENVIVGQGAIFDLPVGDGRVVAFSFNPLHRFLNHNEFPLVWNALMSWNDRVATPATTTTAAEASAND